jgi:hypothetical protein
MSGQLLFAKIATLNIDQRRTVSLLCEKSFAAFREAYFERLAVSESCSMHTWGSLTRPFSLCKLFRFIGMKVPRNFSSFQHMGVKL